MSKKIEGSVDLALLPGAKIKAAKGANWLIINLDKTEAVKLVERKNGEQAAFMNIKVAEKKEPMFGKSHYVEASLTTAEREANTERRFLGDITEVEWNETQNRYVPCHEATSTPAPATAPAAPSFDEDEDDLPF